MANRRLLHLSVLIFKIVKFKSPQYLSDKLIYRGTLHSVNIRTPNQLNIPQHSTTKFQSSFSYQAPNIFNSINDSLKNLGINSFKRNLKQCILNKQ